MKNQVEILREKLNHWDLDLTEKQLEQFVLFYELLVEKNKVMNLTAITEFEEVAVKHFLDSISVCSVMDLHRDIRVLDLGTGAGFPGLPIKIAFPEAELVLVDALRKRVDFLQDTIAALGLSEISALHYRAEEFGREEEYREAFDLGVSRAVSALPVLSELVLPNIKIGGTFVAYKSGTVEEEVAQARKAIDVLGGEISDIIKFRLPETEIDRSFVVISKVSSTPEKYPRRPGIPEKKPIS